MNKILILFGLFFNLKAEIAQKQSKLSLFSKFCKEKTNFLIQNHFWKTMVVYFLIQHLTIIIILYCADRNTFFFSSIILFDLVFFNGYIFFFKAKNFKKLEILSRIITLIHCLVILLITFSQRFDLKFIELFLNYYFLFRGYPFFYKLIVFLEKKKH